MIWERRTTIGKLSLACATVVLVAGGCPAPPSGPGDDGGNGGPGTGDDTFGAPLAVTDSMAGEWDLSVTETACASGALTSIEEFQETVCPGDVLGQGLVSLFDSCATSSTDPVIVIECRQEFVVEGCAIALSLDLSLTLMEDSVWGGGTWSSQIEGACEGVTVGQCQNVSVQGTRISTDVSGCDVAGVVSP